MPSNSFGLLVKPNAKLTLGNNKIEYGIPNAVRLLDVGIERLLNDLGRA